ncbi:GntR family transcriptional regulator [Georgenia satyanarayanai]|uniref:GntR family transcriptional regulator n=1 Tax=Georgenia satyanarayanai TaxID=860221 RepID=UPI0012641927|nr:GntR family transcriptional regulator [Georgenia satyanarayanai]
MAGQQRDSAPARYEVIEGWLRDRVRSGMPGDLLPSEAELAEQFGVSRMTARQAVQNLARDGLVDRRRGSGTYIAIPPIRRHGSALTSFSSDMRRRGLTATSRLLRAELVDGSPDDLEALRLAPGSRVVSISRLRLADGVPMSIETAVLPLECAPVLSRDLENGSLQDALGELGREPAIARARITARTATAAEARLLGVPTRSALLVERRVILDTEDRPLEHTESRYVAERYIIDAVFTVCAER